MSDDAKGSEPSKSDFKLDLSALDKLSLGPDWVSGKVPSSKVPRTRGSEHTGSHSSTGGRPRPRRTNDRRSRSEDGGRGEGGRGDGGGQRGGERGRSERGGFDRRGSGGRRFEREEIFEPVLTADFYPEEAPYTALANVIRTSCRTFELFEIAHLILEKPERWVCVAKHPGQKSGEPAMMFASVPDGLPFLSEQEAINHTLGHYLDQFCTVEAIEVDPPAGTFQMIHKCGVTGELLSPPNYHKYASIVREHHQRRVSKMPFERFQAKLESVRDEESIAAWLEKMKQRNRYTLKVSEGEEAKVFEDFDDLRLYLVTTSREKLVRPAYSVRVVGKDVHLLPKDDILRKSIEALHAQQVKFPLETANNLRSRLRRTNFHLYKKGSKGISYVSAVKRRFRSKEEVLSESLSDLISFIEAHPNVKASTLPHTYLGIGEKEGEKPTVTEIEVVEDKGAEAAPESTETVEPAAVAEVGETEVTETETPAAEATEETPAEAATEEETTEAPAAETPKEATPTAEVAQPTEAVTPSVESKKAVVSDDPQLKLLRRDLHYLVSQGYVVEYSDGRLFALPVREEPIEKPAKSKKKSKAAKKESVEVAKKTDEEATKVETAGETPPKAEGVEGEEVDSTEAPVAAVSEETKPEPADAAVEEPVAVTPEEATKPEPVEAAVAAEPVVEEVAPVETEKVDTGDDAPESTAEASVAEETPVEEGAVEATEETDEETKRTED